MVDSINNRNSCTPKLMENEASIKKGGFSGGYTIYDSNTGEVKRNLDSSCRTIPPETQADGKPENLGWLG